MPSHPKSKLSDSDKELFNEAMKGIKKINHTKLDHEHPLVKKRNADKTNETAQRFSDEEESNLHFYDDQSTPSVRGDDYLYFARPGIQYKMLRKLRNGQYNVEAILDLHGKTVEEARDLLKNFLNSCLYKGIRHLLIIHGKGHSKPEPVLKNKLNQWLRQIEPVLAFCSATPKDGQRGALYILLRLVKKG